VDHPLAMDAEAMRRAGYATVDALASQPTVAAELSRILAERLQDR
jgi:hypothetical protein